MPTSRQEGRKKHRQPILPDNAMTMIQGRAGQDTRLTIGALRQLIILSALSADKSIIEAPRMPFLAELTGRSHSSAQRDFKLLISCGYIERQKFNYQRSWVHLLTPGE